MGTAAGRELHPGCGIDLNETEFEELVHLVRLRFGFTLDAGHFALRPARAVPSLR
jgi:sugar phosphate isomerase/epimerase